MLAATGVARGQQIRLENPHQRLPLAEEHYIVRLNNAAPAALVKALGRRYPDAEAGAGFVRLRVDHYGLDPAVPTQAERRDSFVVDFKEPVFASIRKAIVARFGASPTTRQLAIFTDQHITKKLDRPFDVASEVARTGEGDCTEHAVLLAALARSFGFAARVVVGVTLFVLDREVVAGGHAWVELSDGNGWEAVDPTRPAYKVDRLYVPLFTFADESVSYGMTSLSSARLMPSSIELE
jgi:transglutaminase-like putative cysteine protease